MQQLVANYLISVSFKGLKSDRNEITVYFIFSIGVLLVSSA
jgi:hypothetical protein